MVEPAKTHYYQPFLTLVGGALATLEETERPEEGLVPDGVHWVKERVSSFAPEVNSLTTESGKRIDYDVLVVAPGLTLAPEEVEGLGPALESDPRVWTNYDPRFVTKGRAAIDSFRGGHAVFTTPDSPLKCGGGPQKIMWIVEEWLRKKGVRDGARVTLTVPGDQIFGVPKYRRTLERLASQRGVELLTHVHLVEVRAERSEAVFENLETREEVVVAYDLLHVTPPQRSAEFIRQSPLAGAGADPDENDQSPAVRDRGLLRGARGGFVDVDRETLQHKRFPNVWSLGDAAALPTAKTGAAVRKQAPVVVENLLAVAAGGAPTAKYDGYTSCPLVVGHNRVVLAEFGYDGSILETFPVDQAKPRYSAWLLKRHLLPLIYWHGMLRGRM